MDEDEGADGPLAGLTPEELGMTRERIREIESKTLAKLQIGRRAGGADAAGIREPRRPVEPSLGPGHAIEQPSESR